MNNIRNKQPLRKREIDEILIALVAYIVTIIAVAFAHGVTR